jgi:hypothetical protein
LCFQLPVLRIREVSAVSLSRVIAFGTITSLGSLSVVFVAADRLAHPAIAAVAPPVMVRAAPTVPDPITTGTVTQGPAVEPPKARAMTGFDTERLNALMRGETLPGARKR